MWHLIVLAAIVGFAQVFFDVAYQSYIPVLVPRDRIADANGKLESTAQLAGVAGPGLGGLALTIIQAPVLLAATAVTYLGSFLCHRQHSRRRAPRAPARTAAPCGSRSSRACASSWDQRLLRSIATCTALTNFFATLLFTMLPLLVLRDLETRPRPVRHRPLGRRDRRPARRGPGRPGLAPRRRRQDDSAVRTAGRRRDGALLPHADLPDIAVGLLMLANAVTSVSVLIYNIAQVSFRQRICPVPLLGRMNASIRFVVWGVMPIGGALSGVLAAALGISPVVLDCDGRGTRGIPRRRGIAPDRDAHPSRPSWKRTDRGPPTARPPSLAARAASPVLSQMRHDRGQERHPRIRHEGVTR